MFRTCIETTETNRTVSKRTETILNLLKNLNILSFTIYNHNSIKSTPGRSPLPSGCNEDNKSCTLRVVYKNIVCSINVKINQKSGSVPPNLFTIQSNQKINRFCCGLTDSSKKGKKSLYIVTSITGKHINGNIFRNLSLSWISDPGSKNSNKRERWKRGGGRTTF